MTTAGPRRNGGPRAGEQRTAGFAHALLGRPLSSYYLLLGVTGLLLALGLMMVLSTTSANQLENGLPPYSVFAKQLLGVGVGLPTVWLLGKAPPALFRRAAVPLMVISLIGLVLVPMFGKSSYGAQRWIALEGVQFQPSEFAKLAFLIWGADLLARREDLGGLRDWQSLLMPLLPGAALLAVLTMLGDDLGTTFVLLMILLALLWVVGAPGRMMFGMLCLVAFALLVLIVVAPYRLERLLGFLNASSQQSGSGFQLTQGKYAIGSGGLFGVGLGAGPSKWGWVPNDTTDFIFAILGEELGLVGTGCVVLLYGGFAYAGLRIARRVTDPFMRLAAAGGTAWVLTQALVNIGAVVGLLPITGVPLPLISYGLSSLLSTLGAIAMLLSFARREPEAARVLAEAEPGRLARFLDRTGARRPAGGRGARRQPAPRRLSAQRRPASGPAPARPRRPGAGPDPAGRSGSGLAGRSEPEPGPAGRSGSGPGPAGRAGSARTGPRPGAAGGAGSPGGGPPGGHGSAAAPPARSRPSGPGSPSRLAQPDDGARRAGRPGVTRGGK